MLLANALRILYNTSGQTRFLKKFRVVEREGKHLRQKWRQVRQRVRTGLLRKLLNRRKLKNWRSQYSPKSHGLSAAQLLVVSFLGLIILGTLAFKLIPGLYRGDGLSFTDAVFTATSAVCVTGLIVVDTATYFTTWGQLVILVLIQLGGLGMLVVTSVIISALGGRPSVRTESLVIGARDVLPEVSPRRLIFNIVRFTFIFEAVGAVLLYLAWGPQLGWREAIWPSVFHSVSAFCNAGFSTNSTSLTGFQDSPLTIAIVSALVIAGGLGFVTITEIRHRLARGFRKKRRLSVYSQLVLCSSGALLLLGWLLYATFEWQGLLVEMPVADKLTNSWFMSVTPRTAGFNTVDYSQASDSTNFLTIILMMIGGSPGSTAGGMKTTTFMLLGLLAWSRLRSQPTVTFAHRSIPAATIERAIGLFVIAVGVVVGGVFVLALIGDTRGAGEPFLMRLFETASAFNTVGLSMGITPHLSSLSRWVVIVLMFAGRTGPLAIAAALVIRQQPGGRYRLAYEDVAVG